jgi:hypothetical protein
MYVARLGELLDQVWDEPALVAEIDRMEALLAPHVPDAAVLAAEADRVRDFVTGRRAALEPELDAGGAAWDLPLRGTPCLDIGGHVTGTFQTTYGTVDDMAPFMTGTGTLDMQLGAVMQSATGAGAAAGFDSASGLGPREQVQLIGAMPDGSLRVVVLFIEPERYAAGVPFAFDWQTAFGVLVRVFGQDQILEGIFQGGMVTFDAAGRADGEPVTGTFDVDLMVPIAGP